MVQRRDFLRDYILAPLGCGLSLGLLALTGCGEEKTPFAPLGKSKDETQKHSELPPGIEVKESSKKGRR